MHRIAVSLLLGALLALTGVVAAAPAAACSCAAAFGARESFAAADAVFTGRLLSREVEHPQWPIVSSGDPALHVFAVERVFKGDVHERQGVVSADSGASCGLELSGDGPFVVFATRSTDAGDDPYTAGLCDGTTPATPELEAELAALGGTAGDAPPTRLPGADATDAAGRGQLPVLLGAAGGLLLLLVAVRLRRSRRETARAAPDRR